MKTLSPAVLAVALLLPGAALMAQPPGPPSFESLDTNHDGSLSKDEMKAMFARMGEGRGQNAERRGPPGGEAPRAGGPGGEGGPGGMGRGQRPDPDAMFARWDADGNGSISKAEFDARPRGRRGMPPGGDEGRDPPQG
jgi:EF-hand domain pair